MTVSVGVALFPTDAEDATGLKTGVAEALDGAEALGGNRTLLRRRPDDVPVGWALDVGADPP